VPLFVPWLGLFLHPPQPKGYDGRLGAELKAMLRPDVLYVAVSQNDEGLSTPERWAGWPLDRNIIVLSAGGYGHVPIPLIKGTLRSDSGRGRAAGKREYLFAFLGTVVHHPARARTLDFLQRLDAASAARGGDVNAAGKPRKVLLRYHGPKWAEKLREAEILVAVRGFGRSTYALAEAVQLGSVVPLYVYDEATPWLPYHAATYNTSSSTVWERLGFQADVGKGLEDLLMRLAAMPPELLGGVLREKHEAMREMRDSHFTYGGVVRMIGRWAKEGEQAPGVDLRCVGVPATVRGNGTAARGARPWG